MKIQRTKTTRPQRITVEGPKISKFVRTLFSLTEQMVETKLHPFRQRKYTARIAEHSLRNPQRFRTSGQIKPEKNHSQLKPYSLCQPFSQAMEMTVHNSASKA